jgi:hypothetical protein
MRTRDYSRLPLGSKVEAGEIRLCPHCNLAGLCEEVEGKQYFVHSQTAGYTQQGGFVLTWEACPKFPE